MGIGAEFAMRSSTLSERLSAFSVFRFGFRIHVGGEGNPLIEGKVIHAFWHDPLGRNLFVIEITNYVDSIYEVRSESQMSDTAEGPIGIWREL